MDKRVCPACGTEQLWDQIWGYANKFCPELCNQSLTIPGARFLSDEEHKEFEDKVVAKTRELIGALKACLIVIKKGDQKAKLECLFNLNNFFHQLEDDLT